MPEQRSTPTTTSSPPACPECAATGTMPIDRVATADLSSLYRQRGVDVAAYFDGIAYLSLHRCASCDLRFFSPPCPGNDAFYEQLQRHDWYYQDEKPEYRYAADVIGNARHVLEVGCGKGAFTAYLPASTSYTGLEFNDEAVRKARAAGIDVRKEPVERHAQGHAGKYDIVCSFQVLEHVPEPASFLDGCVAALADGGLLLVAVPAEDSFLAVAPNAPLNMPPHHALRWSDAALRAMAERRGLTVVDFWHEPVAPFHQDWQAHALAHHYFVLTGVLRRRLIDNGLAARAVGRLLRDPRMRQRLARKVGERHPRLGHGHTVVLVARKDRAGMPSAQLTA